MDLYVENWRKYLEELVDPDSIDLSSFAVKDSLNQELWTASRLKPVIRSRLLEIAQDFFESLGLSDVELKDVTFTGSLANYTWSSFSDIDLHLIIDFKEVDENIELVENWLSQVKLNWNREHNIEINGFEVELYMQNESDPHISSGVYSILEDKWIKEPVNESPSVNWKEVQEKVASLMNQIDDIEKLYNENQIEASFSYAECLKEKLRRYRKTGLERGGEFSIENITFKTLRRNGYLEKLSSLKNDSYDSQMTISENRLWLAHMNEAAVKPEELPHGWIIHVQEKAGGDKVNIFLKNERNTVVGKILLSDDKRLPCIKALSVDVSQAPKGYGPLLYDLAMEISGDRGIYSDRIAVSHDAQRIWDFYEQKRSDVQSFHPLELIDDEHLDSECSEDIVDLFGEEWEDDPSNKIFKKKSNKLVVLSALKAANKISFI